MRPATGEPHPFKRGTPGRACVSEATNLARIELAPSLREEGHPREGVGEVEASAADRLRRGDDAVRDGVLGALGARPGHLLPVVAHRHPVPVDVDPGHPGRNHGQRVALDDEVGHWPAKCPLGELDVLQVAADQVVLVLGQEPLPVLQYRHGAPIRVPLRLTDHIIYDAFCQYLATDSTDPDWWESAHRLAKD